MQTRNGTAIYIGEVARYVAQNIQRLCLENLGYNPLEVHNIARSEDCKIYLSGSLNLTQKEEARLVVWGILLGTYGRWKWPE